MSAIRSLQPFPAKTSRYLEDCWSANAEKACDFSMRHCAKEFSNFAYIVFRQLRFWVFSTTGLCAVNRSVVGIFRRCAPNDMARCDACKMAIATQMSSFMIWCGRFAMHIGTNKPMCEVCSPIHVKHAASCGSLAVRPEHAVIPTVIFDRFKKLNSSANGSIFFSGCWRAIAPPSAIVRLAPSTGDREIATTAYGAYCFLRHFVPLGQVKVLRKRHSRPGVALSHFFLSHAPALTL